MKLLKTIKKIIQEAEDQYNAASETNVPLEELDRLEKHYKDSLKLLKLYNSKQEQKKKIKLFLINLTSSTNERLFLLVKSISKYFIPSINALELFKLLTSTFLIFQTFGGIFKFIKKISLTIKSNDISFFAPL